MGFPETERTICAGCGMKEPTQPLGEHGEPYCFKCALQRPELTKAHLERCIGMPIDYSDPKKATGAITTRFVKRISDIVREAQQIGIELKGFTVEDVGEGEFEHRIAVDAGSLHALIKSLSEGFPGFPGKLPKCFTEVKGSSTSSINSAGLPDVETMKKCDA